MQEALALEQRIPEFEIKRTMAEYEKQLSKRPNHILIAQDAGRIVGFKVAYQKSAQELYSWLGGALPEYRNRGIATLLREQQERWALTQGYKVISVDTYNKYGAMICMLVSNGYTISSFESDANPLRSKISFVKDISITK